MKKITKITALLFNMAMGVIIGGAIGFSPFEGMVGAVVLSLVAGALISMPKGVAMEGLYREIWTGELVRKLNAAMTATFLDLIPDYSAIVENDIIHMVEVGADPDVLINNTTYPIEIQKSDESDIAISLDKFQTKATPVTDDELHNISYDKMGVTVEKHSNAILTTKFMKAIHALAPQADTAKTPIIITSGDAESATNRKRIRREDIIALKEKFDKLQIPTDARILVLCSDHVNDLLLSDQKFTDQYYNYQTGKISNLYSFQVYEYVGNPYFKADGTKIAFGTAPSAGQFQASVAYYAKRMFKATGSTKAYISRAENDPLNQQNLINYRHYFITLPKLQEAIGAIVSATGV